jgi:type I restriction enzyme S subunit
MTSEDRDWTSCTLGEAAVDVRYGYTASAVEDTVGPRFLRITDFSSGVLDWSRVPSCAIEEKEAAKYRLATGDVVIARTGPVGISAYLHDPPDSVFASYLVRFRFDDAECDPRFMGYLLRSPQWTNYVEGARTGSVQPQLNATLMKAFEFLLPPLREQRRIAWVLGSLDDKIEGNRRLVKTLEQTAAALFKARFTDFVGHEKLLDSEIGPVPSGWEIVPLEDVLAEIEVGSRPRGGVSQYTTGVPSIGAESIVGLGQFDYAKTKYVPPEFFETMKRGHAKHRDVLLYKDGGRPGEFEPHVTLFGDGFPFDEFAINEHVYRLRVGDDLGQSWLYFALSSNRVMNEMRIKGTGVAIPGLNSSQVRSLTMLIPPRSDVRAFDAAVEPLLTQLLALCRQNRQLSSVRDTLLPRLIAGELRTAPETELVP